MFIFQYYTYLFPVLLSLSALPWTVLGLECYCEGDGCPEHHMNNTCAAARNSKCFASVREHIHEDSGHREEIYSYGCLPPDENTIMQCKGNLVPHRLRVTIICCDGEDSCNKNLDPELKALTTTQSTVAVSESGLSGPYIPIVGVVVIAIVLAIGCGTYALFYFRKRKHLGPDSMSCLESQALVFSPSSDGHKNLPEMTSGSGSGFPVLVQSTIARQLTFIENIGKGRYGEVWKARYHDQPVAVKVFLTTDADSWERERELYQTCMLRHENILGYIAADIGGTGSSTQMLLVTEYQKASLYDFLREMKDRNERLKPGIMVKMAHSIACGLSHLHSDIVGTVAKPPIAHRDIKSKNILVKMDGVTCVLADFGLAVRSTVDTENLPDKEKRQGTRRYMAPEILDFSMERNNFVAFQKADVYSLSLVFWELLRSTEINGQCEGYELPYANAVGSDPSFDEMREVVCNRQIRPEIPENWIKAEPAQDAMLGREFGKMLKETWSAKPSVRWPALRIQKNLRKIAC